MIRATFILLLVAVSAAVPWLVHHQAQSQWATKEELMRQQASQATQLAADNERLSNAANPSAAARLSPSQARELAALRNEVAQLRQTSAEAEAARAANRQLEQQLAPPGSTPAGPDYWPKDQLAFAGFADPDSAVKSALWAMKNGDLKALFNCFPPEMQPAIQKEFEKDLPEAVTQKLKAMTDSFQLDHGYRIVERKTNSPDEVMISVFCDGQKATQNIMVKKFGADCKINPN